MFFRYHIIANPTAPLGIILQNSKSQPFKVNFSPTWSMHSPRRERKMLVASGHSEYNAEYRSEYHDEYHGGNHDEYHTEYWAEYRGEYHGEYHGGLWACCPLLPSQLTYFRFLRSLMIHTMMAVLLLLRKIKDLHMETKFSHHTIPIFCLFGMNSTPFSSFTSYHYLTVMMAMMAMTDEMTMKRCWSLAAPSPPLSDPLSRPWSTDSTFRHHHRHRDFYHLCHHHHRHLSEFHQRKTLIWKVFFFSKREIQWNHVFSRTMPQSMPDWNSRQFT